MLVERLKEVPADSHTTGTVRALPHVARCAQAMHMHACRL